MDEIVKQHELNIIQLRGELVVLDVELARYYGIKTGRLMEQIGRNPDRFPSDFVFQLTDEEFSHLKSHFATSSHGGTRKLPFAFTEQGAYMAATVLKTPQAAKTSVDMVRTFKAMKNHIMKQNSIVGDLYKMIREVDSKHDANFVKIVGALQDMINKGDDGEKKMGFLQ